MVGYIHIIFGNLKGSDLLNKAYILKFARSTISSKDENFIIFRVNTILLQYFLNL